ncbi:hypothetical protein [Sulfoacidibacillus thermotolerans]|uniref:TIGR02710 family CRISPR-associated protein n=1 Tax=Sulfoacidibacillus thermotolerans TaxID=1765684 RepID=A0A2U3D8G0_SULT2|nr:hypothetical protein [Sulfoacidibacillus thermotolerans]PWI57568.1 hypothetical protein BM613_08080 [Sulfoacidibacillus thermotolerans]
MTTNVLITFVGSRDPFGDHGAEGSVITLVRELHPDEVILLSVDEKGRHQAEETKEWMTANDWVPATKIYLEHVEGDPIDYHFLLGMTHTVIQRHRFRIEQATGSLPTWYANHSSGTPQMKTTLILMKSIGELGDGEVYQVIDPQYVDSSHKRVSPVAVTFLREGALREKLWALWDGGDYGGAITVLNELRTLSVHREVKESIEWVLYVVQGYRFWELGLFGQAIDKMKQAHRIIKEEKSFQSLKNWVNQQLQWLSQPDLQQYDYETEINLFELYRSIPRYIQRERYTDALSRFYRFLEGSVKYDFRLQYGVNLQDVKPQSVRPEIREAIQQVTGKERIPNQLELYLALRVLRQMAPERWSAVFTDTWISVGGDMTNGWDAIDSLRKLRNHSLAAHGMLPVKRDEAEKAKQVASRIAQHILTRYVELQASYPFGLCTFRDNLQQYWGESPHVGSS